MLKYTNNIRLLQLLQTLETTNNTVNKFVNLVSNSKITEALNLLSKAARNAHKIPTIDSIVGGAITGPLAGSFGAAFSAIREMPNTHQAAFAVFGIIGLWVSVPVISNSMSPALLVDIAIWLTRGTHFDLLIVVSEPL
jgi:hypothetical protein